MDDPTVTAVSDELIAMDDSCVWIEIEDGSGIYNTCKEGWEFHLEEGLELYPHCMWCGKKVLVAADIEDYPEDDAALTLADVGECERCLGTRKIRTYRKLGDETPQVLDCPDCTGKQPRPAAEEEPRECGPCDGKVTADQRASCGFGRCPFRPAAHTAQSDADTGGEK